MLKNDFAIRDGFIGRNHETRNFAVQRKAAAQPFRFHAFGE
jgi:hypothetical protein